MRPFFCTHGNSSGGFGKQKKITPTLTTERLILRPFCMEDEQAMFENWTSDPEVARFMVGKAHSSRAITRCVLESFCHKNSRQMHWAIVLKPDDPAAHDCGVFALEPVGSVSFVHIDPVTRDAELGYALSRVLWGQRIMPEAIHAVTEWAAPALRIRRFTAQVFASNGASVKTLCRCGFVQTSVRKNGALRNTGEAEDVLVFQKRVRQSDVY